MAPALQVAGAMLPVRTLPLAACWLFACSSPTNGAPISTPADASVDAAPDVVACPTATHAADDGSCTSTLSWQHAGTVMPARDHHVTFAATSAAGTFLYIAGGMGDMTANPVPLYDDAQMTALAGDGTLGVWHPTTALPQKLAGHSVAVLGDVVVVTGGMLEQGLSSATLVSRIGADGALGAWGTASPIPSGRYHHTTVVYNQWIYLVGGLDSGSLSDTARATVSSDGTVGAWTAMTPLPKRRSHHSCIVHDGAVYVLGGGDVGTNTFYTDVLRAPIAGDGTLGAWTKVGDLQENVGANSLVELGGLLYSFGGVKGSASGLAVVSTVRRAPFQSDGTLGAWENTTPLPVARGHVHQTPLVGSHLFSVGGAQDDGSALADIVIGTLQ